MKYVTKHGDDFIQAALGSAQQTVDQNRQQMQKELLTLEVRDRGLDVLFSRMYDDKMVITFHYEDGEKCVTFDEINEMLNKKANSDNQKIIRVRLCH